MTIEEEEDEAESSSISSKSVRGRARGERMEDETEEGPETEVGGGSVGWLSVTAPQERC